MALKIYNTLTKKKEIFKPIKRDQVNFFVCGPTVYDFSHIGHAKTYVQFDIIVNYLRHIKNKVNYVQNITDIDDKIIRRAEELKQDPLELSDKFYKAHLKDMESLGIISVSEYIKATDRIEEIVSQVKRLIGKGFAYETSDGVYFNLKKDKEYGKLSGRTAAKAEDALTKIDTGKEKRNKGDFCLWKFSKEGEPSWDSPFGKGRPGWHIEDTAITEKEFGPQYDIHGGAMDLIFPHHEAEIAQMESITGKKPFVRYWMHTGFLDIDKEKMSKSLGNFRTIQETLKNYNKNHIRFFFAASHYRSRINFSEELLEHSKNSLERINDFIINLDKRDNTKLLEKTRAEFYSAMDDDFNTPKAFAVLFDFISKSNKESTGGKKALKLLMEIDEIFKIFTFEGEVPKKIKELIGDRQEARRKKDWKSADKIRGRLADLGYILEDKGEGYILKKR